MLLWKNVSVYYESITKLGCTAFSPSQIDGQECLLSELKICGNRTARDLECIVDM